MTFEARILVVVLALFAAASLLAPAFVPAALRRAGRLPAASRPRAIFRTRLLTFAPPLGGAALSCGAGLLVERREVTVDDARAHLDAVQQLADAPSDDLKREATYKILKFGT